MIALIFVLFVMYTLACVADGPDVKPLWKRWLGEKLLNASQHYIRFSICNGSRFCVHVNHSMESVDQYKRMVDALQKHIYRMAALNPSSICVLRSSVKISESDLHDIYVRTKPMGELYFEAEKQRAVRHAVEVCKNKILDGLSKGFAFDVEQDERTKAITIHGSLVINRID